jgi:hypothetical protein
MRLHALYLAGALAALAIPLSAGAQPVQANRQAPATEQYAAPPTACPAGWVWEPAGYLTSGKWEAAHCAFRDYQQNW